MTFRKRLAVVIAALRQDWHMHTCHKCHTTQWVEGTHTWTDQSECVPCETAAFDDWIAKQEAYKRREIA